AYRSAMLEEISDLRGSALARRALDLDRLERAVRNWPDGNWFKRRGIMEHQVALGLGLGAGRYQRWVEENNLKRGRRGTRSPQHRGFRCRSRGLKTALSLVRSSPARKCVLNAPLTAGTMPRGLLKTGLTKGAEDNGAGESVSARTFGRRSGQAAVD